MWITRLVRRHHEAAKFLVVGGTCFVVTTAVNYALKLTVLTGKSVTALGLATVLGTILSYVLNREWSFRTRGGRERHHEAALFFAVSAVGVVLTVLPLYASRYVLLLRLTSGTALAMVFRLWAFKRFVFPHAQARPHRRTAGNGPRSGALWHRQAEQPSRDTPGG